MASQSNRKPVPETVRVWTRFTTEKYEQMQEWSDQLGMTLSQFTSICAWAGARQVMRTLEPSTFFDASQWGEIFKYLSAQSMGPEDDQAKELIEQVKAMAKEVGVDIEESKEDEQEKVAGLLRE